MAYTEDDLKKELDNKEYKYGFYTDIESDTLPVGLNEDIVQGDLPQERTNRNG